MSLTEEEIRQLLRECVTVVKPGEVLVIRVPDFTPEQLREYSDMVRWWLDENAPGVKCLITVGEELGVAEVAPGRDHAAWLKGIREQTFRHERVESVRLTHLPTGVTAKAGTRDKAIAALALALAHRGDITINDARAALGLPALKLEGVPGA